MFLMYVDESGDTGEKGSPYFALSGLVIHESAWAQALDDIIRFRRQLKRQYGLGPQQEIHAAPLLSKPGKLASIEKHRRLMILRDVLEFQSSALASKVNVISIVLDKRANATTDVFDYAWKALLTRLHNTIRHRNFPCSQHGVQDTGLVIADRGQESQLRRLARRIRRHNPIPSHRNIGQTLQHPLNLLVEDPVSRDSRDSLFIQLCDVHAYFLMQHMTANSYVRRQGARNWINKLGPIACTQASPRTHLGIVHL